MKEIAEAPDMRETGTIVEVKKPKRGTLLTINPIKFSDFTPEITSAPLLGEHSDEILAQFGYTPAQIKTFHDKKVVATTA